MGQFINKGPMVDKYKKRDKNSNWTNQKVAFTRESST